MTAQSFQQWMNTVAPWVAIVVTLYVALRVQAVHQLVNSEMDKFRATLKALAEANEAAVFRAGQQNIRDTNQGITVAAADATREAAIATAAAAEAVRTTKPGK